MGNSCSYKLKRNDNNDEQNLNINKKVNIKIEPLIDWKTSNSNYKYNWVDILTKNETEITNNLFGINSGLNKYDKLFDTNACEHQKLIFNKTFKNKYYRLFIKIQLIQLQLFSIIMNLHLIQ